MCSSQHKHLYETYFQCQLVMVVFFFQWTYWSSHTTIPSNQFQKDYLAFSHNISLFFFKKEDVLLSSPRIRHKIGSQKERANGFDLNSFWAPQFVSSIERIEEATTILPPFNDTVCGFRIIISILVFVYVMSYFSI